MDPSLRVDHDRGRAACNELRVSNVVEHVHAQGVTPNAVPSGYGPSDLYSAYKLSSGGGAGQTIAIVDAHGDPNAESEMAVYRSQYGLPACTTANGCFRKVSESGGTSYARRSTGWSGEISLYGAEYPAASKYVTAVGGTSLSKASNTRGWTWSVWSTSSSEGAGSGCSKYDAKPAWQTGSDCAKRTVADVSAVADSATGVAVYQTYGASGWTVYGGTSVASPLIASVYADAGTPGSSTYPVGDIYGHTGALYDVTTGATASCSPAYLCAAGVGYDGPTGWGTPDGLTAFVG